jgi:hypothetical protein
VNGSPATTWALLVQNKMKNVYYCLWLLSCALWLSLPGEAQTIARRKVLIIISDDQGYGELLAPGNLSLAANVAPQPIEHKERRNDK